MPTPRILLSLLCAAAFTLVNAQRYFFENLGVADGLPASKVYDLLQDSTGLLWLCTGGGLAAYDGREVWKYDIESGVDPDVPRVAFIDAQKRLWCGHSGGGISVRAGNNAAADRFVAIRCAGTPLTSDVSGFAQGPDGVIWVGTFGQGVFRFVPPAELDTVPIPMERMEREHGIGLRIGQLQSLPDGRIVALDAEAGLKRWDPSAKTFVDYEPAGTPTELEKVTSYYVDGSGAHWIGTQDQGAYRMDGRDGQTVRYDINDGLPSNFVMCFSEDAEGRVWIGTWQGGVSVVANGRLLTFTDGDGLHGQNVRKLVRDQEGNMLIATNENGLDIFKGARFRSFGADDGLVEGRVRALIESRSGQVWFGTDGGITLLDPATGGTARAKSITMQRGELTSNRVRCLKEGPDGHIWIGTDGGGLVELDPSSFKTVYHDELSGILGDNNLVTALENGANGAIWAGCVSGLILLRAGEVPYTITANEGLPGNNVTALYRSVNGDLWVGTASSGIGLLPGGDQRKARAVPLGPAVTPTCFTTDDEGRIWVGTEAHGLFILDEGKVTERYDERNGLLTNSVRSLITDDQGSVWVGTSKGLNQWIKGVGFRLFTERSGFVGIEANAGAVCRTRSGDLWFGTAKGAVQVRAEKEHVDPSTPRVALRAIEVNQERRQLLDGLDLSSTERDVRISYSCVSFSDPEAVRYQYMMDGLNTEWQPVTNESDVHYQGLNPGNYVFKVKAMNRSGIWSDPPTEFRFTINPPWFRTWWAYSLFAVLIGIGVFSFIKVRERQLRLRNLVLEKKVEERTAEVVAQSKEIEGQKVRIEDLLLNILPKEISEELKEKGSATARRHEDVTVLFTDMKGFTQVAESMRPEELVHELDECFVHFDDIMDRYGIEKIKTIGDSYMCASGVPSRDAWHAHKVVLAALEIRELMREWTEVRTAKGKRPWQLRIGVHSGAVVAGVVGKRKFAYDIWGDTVNTASRMESSGEAGELNISGATYALVKEHFVCEHRGAVEAKNKGRIDMYFVKRIKPEWTSDGAGTLPNKALCRMIGVHDHAGALA